MYWAHTEIQYCFGKQSIDLYTLLEFLLKRQAGDSAFCRTDGPDRAKQAEQALIMQDIF